MISNASIFILIGFCLAGISLVSAQEDDDRAEEETAEGEYSVQRTKLQRDVLSGYNKKNRPVKNGFNAVEVRAVVYLTHVSVNQREQTISLAGIIRLEWYDELAVWDPAQYLNIRRITLNQWDIWSPDLKVTNSVSGLGQYFEISKRAHAILESRGPNRTNIIARPKFNIKIGCKFDYSRYPDDVQNCTMGLFTVNRMSEVKLSYYFDPYMKSYSQPVWYYESGKSGSRNHSNQWFIKDINYQTTYFVDGKERTEAPETAEEIDRTWPVLLTKLQLERHAPHYTWAMLVPAVISFLTVVASYFLPSPNSSIYVLLANFFMIDIFFEDLLTLLPPVIGGLPRIVYYIGVILIMTTVSLFVQYWFKYLMESSGSATGFAREVANLKRFLPQRLRGEVVGDTLVMVQSGASGAPTVTVDDTVSWRTVVNTARILVASVVLIVFVISTLFLLL